MIFKKMGKIIYKNLIILIGLFFIKSPQTLNAIIIETQTAPKMKENLTKLKNAFKVLDPVLFKDIDNMSFEEMNKKAQENFLRKPNQERWNLQETALNEAQKKALKELGLLESIKPNEKNYEYIVILGNTAEDMKHRLNYGLQFKTKSSQIIFLTGERVLNEINEKEMHELLIKQKKEPTEENAAKEICKNSNALFINCKKQKNAPRATTNDTIKTLDSYFKQKGIKQAKILFVSSNPYILYQNQTIQTILLKSEVMYKIETIGSNYKDITVEIAKDTLARFLYATCKVQEEINNNPNAIIAFQ